MLLPFQSTTDQRRLQQVTLHLYFTYPPTYPDVLPDMEFEPIDEDSGELHEEESEAVLGQLRMIVRSAPEALADAYRARRVLG